MESKKIEMTINGQTIELGDNLTGDKTTTGKRQETLVFQQPQWFTVDTIRQVITYDEKGKVVDIQSTNLSEVQRQQDAQRKREIRERQQREAWENLSPLGKFFYYFFAVILGVLFLFGVIGLFIH